MAEVIFYLMYKCDPYDNVRLVNYSRIKVKVISEARNSTHVSNVTSV